MNLMKTQNWTKGNKMTPRQQQVLDVITAFRAKNGYSPTQVKLAEILGVSSPAILLHIRELVKIGALKSVGKKAIRINKEHPYTQRQYEVMSMFMGNPNACQKQIADLMGISAPSLCQHIKVLLGMRAIKVLPTESLRTTIQVTDPEVLARAAMSPPVSFQR